MDKHGKKRLQNILISNIIMQVKWIAVVLESQHSDA
jgi:hypothetical protein